MEEMKDEKFEGSENGDAKNGVLFIDLPFIITVILDLSALNLTAIMLLCKGEVGFGHLA